MPGSLKDPGGCAGARGMDLCIAGPFSDFLINNLETHFLQRSQGSPGAAFPCLLCFVGRTGTKAPPSIAAVPDRPNRACAAAKCPNQFWKGPACWNCLAGSVFCYF